ncbi:MAG: hypothetical protein EU532_07585 [Promethearchaeota archaeon]|nr:MAG: hypothetical protein EU532_07585 [Candidatus Lokiarchaeota archaeon]
MADLEKSEFLEEKHIQELCMVYVLYFDEAQGHIPLLIFPDDRYREDKKFMRPIKYHSIWFLSSEDLSALDHIDLEYKGFTYFGKKFLTKSKREKRRAGLEEETPETIVIIVSLPKDIEIFGDGLIKILTKEIKDKFDDKLYKIIECEIAKEQIIKTEKVKKCIKEGTEIKNQLRGLIADIADDYFSRVIKKKDSTSIKQQKAISFLSLIGYDISHIVSDSSKGSFSNIKIFDPTKVDQNDLSLKAPFMISNITLLDDSKELEILVHNKTDKEYSNLRVKITHVRELFEKEVMDQLIDIWFPDEELLFISPILPQISEYLFFIIDEHNKNKLLSKKIDINLLS